MVSIYRAIVLFLLALILVAVSVFGLYRNVELLNFQTIAIGVVLLIVAVLLAADFLRRRTPRD